MLYRAYLLATESPDPSTQNSALLIDKNNNVLVGGINAFPDDVRETSERWERPTKYDYVEHAERNAIYAAARRGCCTRGLTMVCPWAPCHPCARAIKQTGIVRLVTHKQALDRSPERWMAKVLSALDMLDEAGVEVILFDGVVGAKGLLHSGQVWNP